MGKEIDVKNFNHAQKLIAELTKDGSISNKPTDDEVKEYAKEFEKAKIGFEEKQFEIGETEKADEIYDFILDFMENHVYWTKNGWMGVLRLHEELTESKKNKKDGDRFVVGYQALEFLFYALSNPGGTGLAAAKQIEKVADIYAEVIEATGKVLEDARVELKDVQWLGDRAAAGQQGFYLEKEDGTQEAHDEAFKSPSPDDILNN